MPDIEGDRNVDPENPTPAQSDLNGVRFAWVERSPKH
jgi:hypothetical protein